MTGRFSKWGGASNGGICLPVLQSYCTITKQLALSSGAINPPNVPRFVGSLQKKGIKGHKTYQLSSAFVTKTCYPGAQAATVTHIRLNSMLICRVDELARSERWRNCS